MQFGIQELSFLPQLWEITVVNAPQRIQVVYGPHFEKYRYTEHSPRSLLRKHKLFSASLSLHLMLWDDGLMQFLETSHLHTCVPALYLYLKYPFPPSIR